MITQKFQNGESKIVIESAETIEEAKKLKFPEGVFSRYFINGKPVESYFSVVQHIIDSTHKGGSFSMPSSAELVQIQKDMMKEQKQAMIEQCENMKKMYKDVNVPKEIFDQFDKIIDSIDETGVRIKA